MNEPKASTSKKRVLVVGGGLVGSLQALYLAKRQFKVDVYEHRPDPRSQKYVKGRSINLALSVRGRAALKAVGAEDHVVKKGIPMYARMIHGYNGKRMPIPYGKEDQYILSIDRRELNEHLIGLVDENKNVNYHFCDKFIAANFEKGEVTFESKDGRHIEQADLIVGCDGAFSGIRRQLMKTARMDYSQEYIPHGYKEIQMLPNAMGDFAMEVNYLHIWPRNTFMMIALPNQNKTFTCTLFMPYHIFDDIKTDEEILRFFEREFPDSIPLIGKKQIIQEYNTNPVGDLISIKCSPYHYLDKVVILGDAAHAMVPFYGQGMNCGFEDCLVLDEMLDKFGSNMNHALAEYSTFRNPDAEAIIDLAMYNYMEMRAHVNSPLFVLRKRFDNFLHWLVPNYWVPLYTMTTFSRIRYHEVVERSKRQDKIVNCLLVSSGAIFIICGTVFLYKIMRKDTPQTSYFNAFTEYATDSITYVYNILPDLKSKIY
ncbi:kynurenine 3-monooxygenase-like [Hydractinia symbiolongicarpus]|uniref:kynurenine 3-monooxygenase-like n=1 Tax=Hydractinia symbiolongicarpus TaxID=13093 RepID=UPI00254B8F63|nr:kynurenine 3-monooxygenase-like [Hydractinia symbiolongicarpus]